VRCNHCNGQSVRQGHDTWHFHLHVTTLVKFFTHTCLSHQAIYTRQIAVTFSDSNGNCSPMPSLWVISTKGWPPMDELQTLSSYQQYIQAKMTVLLTICSSLSEGSNVPTYEWVSEQRFNVPLDTSFRGRFLQAKWPNQQRQSTEGSQLATEIGFSPTRTTPPCYNMN